MEEADELDLDHEEEAARLTEDIEYLHDEADKLDSETGPQTEFPEEPPGSEIFDDSDREWDHDKDHEK